MVAQRDDSPSGSMQALNLDARGQAPSSPLSDEAQYDCSSERAHDSGEAASYPRAANDAPLPALFMNEVPNESHPDGAAMSSMMGELSPLEHAENARVSLSRMPSRGVPSGLADCSIQFNALLVSWGLYTISAIRLFSAIADSQGWWRVCMQKLTPAGLWSPRLLSILYRCCF